MAEEQLLKAWPEWKIEKQLGMGTYGIVYQVVRTEYNFESRAAVKVISIPPDTSEVDSLRSEGLDLDQAKTYLRRITDGFLDEIRLMEALKGTQNIVGIEDYKVLEKEDLVGWEIYIRMELLTPLQNLLCGGPMSEAQVIRLGREICTALSLCGKQGIIHRDIKPENIFVNDFGHFKLGDFGVARRLEGMTNSLSQRGTLNYMAPEVAKGQPYDARADIYSLGLVLYRLLNQNRLPFLDTGKQLLSPGERKLALEHRLDGEVLPPPSGASAALAEVILRACAYDPERRFSSPEEMDRALARLDARPYAGAPDPYQQLASISKSDSVPPPVPAGIPVSGRSGSVPEKTIRNKVLLAACAAVLAVVLGCVLGASLFFGRAAAGENDREGSFPVVGKDPADGTGGGGGGSLADPDPGDTPWLSDEIIPLPVGPSGYSPFLYLRIPGNQNGVGIWEDTGEFLDVSYDSNSWFDVVSVTLNTDDDRLENAEVQIRYADGEFVGFYQSYRDGFSFEVSAGTYLIQFITDGNLETYQVTMTFDHNGSYNIDLTD